MNGRRCILLIKYFCTFDVVYFYFCRCVCLRSGKFHHKISAFMYKDREGGIWIGTYFGGVNYIPKQNTFFEKYYPMANRNSISGERVSGICEDTNGNIWIGTEDAGLNKFNPATKKFEHFKINAGQNSLSYHNVHDLIIDGDHLWVGFFNNGIDVINLKNNQVKHYSKSNTPGMFIDREIQPLSGVNLNAFDNKL